MKPIHLRIGLTPSVTGSALATLPAFFLALILFLALMVAWQVAADAAMTVTFGDNTGDDFPGTVEDALIFERSGYEDFNYGGRVVFQVGDPANTARTRRTVIRFKDIASKLGPGIVITSATMYLYCDSESSTTDYSISAYRVLLDWGEGNSNAAVEVGAVCWNYTKYNTAAWNTIGCEAASDVIGEDSTADRRATAEDSTLITGTGWFSWDLTTAVQNWCNDDWSEYGVVLINDSEGTADSLKQFRSSESTIDGQRPYLSVTYEEDTHYVCAGGSNEPPYTSPATAALKIQDAIGTASPGDTVQVCDGTYTEDITIDKNHLTLQSENGRDYTYIVGQVKFDAYTADLTGCTLDGFDIHGSSESNGLVFIHAFWERTDPDNPTIRKITNTYIQNCDIHDNTYDYITKGPGIRLHGAAAPTIQNNLIHDNAGRGIDAPFAINSSGGILSSCSYNNYCGTLLSPGPTEYITITQNSIYNNGSDGIRLHGWYGTSSSMYQPDRLVNVTIDGNNEIYSNYPPSPSPEGSGISLAYLNEAHIENNQIHNNGSPYGAGIRTNAVASLTIQGNHIYENMMAGIRITPYGAGDLITIGGPLSSDGNDIYNNLTGIVFRDGGSPGTFADGSSIQKNYIHNNAQAGIAIGQGNLAGGSQMTYQGKITITQNNICQNAWGGIGIHTSCYLCDTCCELEITKNDIYNSTTRGGIHTGDDWGRFSTWGSMTVNVTIKQNKVHHNYLGGIDVRHATGVIKNNLAYRNYRAGIRFGPGFGVGDEVINNTMAYNGDNVVIKGGGIIHDDPDTCDESCKDAGGNCAADCEPDGTPDPALVVKNNIVAYNIKAGTRACECDRDYNLYYDNWYGYGYGDCSWTVWPGCKKRQLGGCWPVALNEIFADPLFEPGTDNYHLQGGSPAKNTGYGGVDMGAYGGSDAIDDNDFLQLPTIIHCLIDGDTDTGSSPEGGTILFFDLGGTYTVKHVRLYGSADVDNTYIWTVYVASTSDGCTGTQVLTGWSVGGASDWYQGDVTDTSGSYIKIETTGDINQHSIFEFQFSEIDVPTLDEHWSTPVSTVSDCTDIYGQCAQ